MRLQHRLSWYAVLALFLSSAGCACVQGMPGQCGPCGGGACGGGLCGSGPFLGYRACAGGCGDTYVDEWVSEPPCVDQCCAGDCRPVRSLLRTLWGSRFVQGCDMCGGGCSSGCSDGSCGYAAAGGHGCTSCDGGGHISHGGHAGGGGCASCGGGSVATEPIMQSSSMHRPAYQSSQPQMVSGSVQMSAPRRVPASVASQSINPARQKIDAKRASYNQ